MVDGTKDKTGATEAAAEEQKPIEAQSLGQYIKDLSFENPSVGKVHLEPGETPNIKVEVNVEARRTGPDIYESSIEIKALATHKEATIYDLELVYTGLFRLRNIPDTALEPFLLINCPALVFPFARRLIADVTREGGFPPLLLEPIDFAQLFMRRHQEATATAKPN